MKIVRIKKGKDISLKGAAQKRIKEAVFSEMVAVKPQDFYGLRARVLSKEGAMVDVGTPVIENKDDQRIKIVAPVSGKVVEVRRGEKRKLLEIVIESNGKQTAVQQEKFSSEQISTLSREKVVECLLASGSWAFIRQRPFDHIACSDVQPKSIFVKAVDTNPLAPDYDVMLKGQEEVFQLGLDIVGKLTEGRVYLCVSKNAKSPVLIQAQGVHVVGFDGPHPSGNVGTHIQHLDPIDKDEAVWYLDAQDVVAIAQSFLTGNFCPEKIITVVGECAESAIYKKIIRGSSVQSVVNQGSYDNVRIISGSVLSGDDVGNQGFLGFYHNQICLIPEGGAREFLGWTMPGWNKFSFSRTFLSSLKKKDSVSIDSDEHGSLRAIVFNSIYDRYIALDVMTFFLIRAILVGEIDEMESLGILECSPEDFALATFACPSKVDVCGIIQQGLDLMEKEQ